jgi:hypothetical protein
MNFVLDLCGFRSCCEGGAETPPVPNLASMFLGQRRDFTRPPTWTCRFLKIERNNSSACVVASNRKGCDIGYGLAANSCEGVNSVDTCTVTALDAITAFAVPNPGGILAEQSVFSGLVVRRVTPLNGSLSLLQTGYVLGSQPFSTVDICDTSR